MRICLAALLFVLLAGCSSWMNDIKTAMVGEDTVVDSEGSRSPASVENSNRVEIDNRTGADFSSSNQKPRGPQLGASEFTNSYSHNNSRSNQGFRSGSNPWSGVGDPSEGSLWRDDTQDNFYFARNVIYSVGDLLVVNIDSEINDALNLRIAQIIGRTSVQQVVADEAGKAAGNEVEKKVQDALGNDKIADAVGKEVQNRTISSLEGSKKFIDVDSVTVRITEILPRGSYRVEGTKRVFVKDAPYSVKYSGIVRDEDIGANKMIASKSVLESKVELTK